MQRLFVIATVEWLDRKSKIFLKIKVAYFYDYLPPTLHIHFSTFWPGEVSGVIMTFKDHWRSSKVIGFDTEFTGSIVHMKLITGVLQ